MAGRDWGKEQEGLLAAIDRAKKNYNELFAEMHANMRAMTFGRDPSDQELAQRVEAADAKLSKANNALYQHTQDHLHSLGC